MKNKKFGFIPLISFAAVFLLSFNLLVLNLNKTGRDIKVGEQNGIKTTQQSQKDGEVLSQQDSYPQIFISGEGGSTGRGGVISIPSTDEPVIQVASYDVSGSAEINIYKADKDALLNYLIHDKEGKQINKNIDISNFEFVGSTNEQINTGYNNASKILLPIGESGIWYVSIKLEGAEENAFVVRSNVGTIVKEGDNEFIFWGQSFDTLRSVTEGNVVVYNLQDNVSELSNISFNSEGVAKSTLTPNADIGMVYSGTDIALIPINLRYLNSGYTYQYFQPKKREARFFIFTDRPIYKPGDNVYFKAVVRDDDDARYTIPSGMILVKVYGNDRNKPVVEKYYSITPDGAIFGEFNLPVDSLTGYYSLSVDLAPGSNNYSLQSSTYFQVEYFRKPEYSIEVSSAQTEYISGDKSSFILSGSYFFGQPLSNQEISYKVYSSDFYEYTYLTDRQQYISDEYRYGYWGGKMLKEGSTVLNEKGTAEVDFDFKLPDDVYKSQVFSIEAMFDDGSGNPSFARKNVLVYSGEYGIFREDRNYGTHVDTPVQLKLKMVTRRSTDISNKHFTANIKGTTWVTYYEPDKKYPLLKAEEESFNNLTATSDSNGNVIFDFTPTREGSYKFTIEGTDSKGNRIIKDFYIWASSPDKPLYTGEHQKGLTIQLDKEVYSHEEVAKLTITSEMADRDVFLSLDRARVNRYQIVKLSGTSAVVELPLTDTDIPNIFAKASSFSKQSLENDTKNISISIDPKKLVVNITPDKKTYGPGDTVTVNVSTTDIAGNPVSANTAVWAVDKALFELVNEKPQKIIDAFWKERYDNTSEGHSLQGINVLTAERGGGCFAFDTQILMAGRELKTIGDVVVGDIVLTRKNIHDPTLVKAKVTDIHKRKVSGYFIINGSMKVTSNHRMLINNFWDEVSKLQLGDKLVNSLGHEESVNSIEWQDGEFEVYNIDVEKYHTYFAGDIWVHNQKGGSDRGIFKDTAYWNPSVQTDSNGYAQIKFDLPDNLTTWVLSSVGSTVNTKVGQIKEELVVTKDVVIRPILPNIIRSDDEVVLSALVQNFTDNGHPFEIGLESEAVDIISEPKISTTIDPSELKQVYWKVKPKNEKEDAEFTFYATTEDENSEDISDKMTVKIPIRAFGFWGRWGKNADGNTEFNVNLAQDGNREKSKVVLSLAPTLFGSLPASMKYLVNYPYGCVEQTTSSLVPAVIAKSNPELFKEHIADKNVDDIIKKSVIKLSGYQRPDGGWTWWYTGYSDPFITSYVVENLLKVRNLGIEVNEDIIERAKEFLERDTYYDNQAGVQMNTNESNVARKYGLTILNSDKAKSIQINMDELSPDLLALVVMTNLKQGDNNPDTNGLSKLLSIAKTQGDEVYWEAGKSIYFGSRDASTALALRAVVTANSNKDVAIKASRYLLRQRRTDYWSNTFGTAQTIQTAYDYVNNIDELNPNYSYVVKLDGKEIAGGTVTNSKQILEDVELTGSQLAESNSKITVEKIGQSGQLYTTLIVEEFHTDKNAKSLNEGLEIRREYISDKGEDYVLGVGDTVTVKITVSGLNLPERYGVISDELPAGMVPINPYLKNEQFGQDNYTYTYGVSGREVTENGMVLSLFKMDSGTQIYTYQARVVSEGDFIVPPATASLMYAPEIYGRSEVQHIKIEKESKLIPERAVKKVINSVLGNKVFLAGVGILLTSGVIGFVTVKRKGIRFDNLKRKPLNIQTKNTDTENPTNITPPPQDEI